MDVIYSQFLLRLSDPKDGWPIDKVERFKAFVERKNSEGKFCGKILSSGEGGQRLLDVNKVVSMFEAEEAAQ